jgi:flagellar protein FlgJ
MSSFAVGPGGPGPSVPIRSTGPSNAGSASKNDETRLKKSALQLEGLFVQRLFAAMRETVPEDGLVSQSNAEGTFTEMLDEKLSQKVPEQYSGSHSLAQALFDQLRQRLASPAAQNTGSDTQR